MSRARTIWALQAALGAVATAVVGLSLAAGVGGVSFDPPPASTLAAACRRFALPDLTLAAVATLSLGSLAVAVLMLAGRSAVRQLRASRRLLQTLSVSGGGPAGAVVFDDPQPQAFCAGLLRPRVYVSTGALRALDAEEVAAVLAHEAHHARLRDPLRLFAARVLSDALFFLPAMRRLAERYGALAELAADRAAVRVHGARPLAAALLAFEAADPSVVGIAPERVDHLLGDRPAWELPFALIAWALVVLTSVATVALRLQDAHGAPALNVPLLAAQLCMVTMAIGPVVVGAVALLSAPHLLRARRPR